MQHKHPFATCLLAVGIIVTLSMAIADVIAHPSPFLSPSAPVETTPLLASELPKIQFDAEHGDSLAQSRLGFTYSTGGGGLERSRAMAVKWWQKAANQGRPAAQSHLGTEYYFGDNEAGIAPDRKKGMILWHEAAAQGDGMARSEIAVAYANGEYAPTDANEEMQLQLSMEQIPAHTSDIPRLLAAAEKGDAFAQSRLGFSYNAGDVGMDTNPQLPVKWWRKAAEQGRAAAQRALGYAYHNGKGVAQDDTQAVFWWHKASAQGDNQAEFELARAFRDGKYTPVNSDEENLLKAELDRQEVERQEEEKRGWLSGIAR